MEGSRVSKTAFAFVERAAPRLDGIPIVHGLFTNQLSLSCRVLPRNLQFVVQQQATFVAHSDCVPAAGLSNDTKVGRSEVLHCLLRAARSGGFLFHRADDHDFLVRGIDVVSSSARQPQRNRPWDLWHRRSPGRKASLFRISTGIFPGTVSICPSNMIGLGPIAQNPDGVIDTILVRLEPQLPHRSTRKLETSASA